MSTKQRQVLLEEVGRATQAYQRATDGFDDAVGRSLNLNPADLRGLDWLTEGPMSAGELSQATGLSTAATTTLLDRLEEKGYIRRGRDPEDRRRIRAELTEEGRERLGALYGPLATRGERLLSGFTDRELEMIRHFLVEATQVVHNEEAKLRSSPKS